MAGTKRVSKKRREQKRDSAPVTVHRMKEIVKADLTAAVKAQAALIVRPVGKPPGTKAFQSVMRAKEILAQSAPLAARLMKTAARVAAAKGDSAPAEFLLKHVSAQDDKGRTVRPLATSVDKLEGDSGPRMPVINIGWINGTAPTPSALPGTVIDVPLLPEHSDS